MKKKKLWIILAVVAAAVFGLAVWLVRGNTAIQTSEYVLTDAGVPAGFSGFRIAQVSDLHNAAFGPGNSRLLQRLAAARPDIVVLTGDLIDSRHTDIPLALRFAEEAARLAPTYFVSGNHEARLSEYEALKAGLRDAGVVVLENEGVLLERADGRLTLLGVDDPSFQTDYLFGDAAAVMRKRLDDLAAGEDGFAILLSHRPELFDVYAESGVELVFSGHAHGGQIRLPLVGGLVAPNQGFFPVYDAGLYTEGRTTMAVSRGLGNSIIPLRVNNRPELVVVELRTAF